MTNLRNLARGQGCMIRLDGCNHNSETTVLAHLRNGHFGMGCKPLDICGIFACSSCHDEIDRRTHRLKQDAIDAALVAALCRQLTWYTDKGYLWW